MDLFHRLSGSRLLEELILLFSEEEPRKAIARLAELDLLRFIHPALEWSPRLEALLKAVENVLDWYRIASLNWEDRKVGVGGATLSGPPHTRMDTWVVYFAALMEVVPDKAVREVLKRLPVPERQAEKIRAGRFTSYAILRRLAKRPPLKPAETYRTLLGLSDEVLLFLMAKTKSEAVKRQISACLTIYQHVKASLTGSDLKAMGLNPGPLYKKILDRLLDARLNGEVKTDADEQDLAKKIAKL